ncbi:ATP-binding protein [Cupriavidus sp. CuC1]|uniref:ATP-binding protein n=1 Tax=Cupriavidus sp. CuC1 TaxID=3373131 RepID=UPI0037D026D5
MIGLADLRRLPFLADISEERLAWLCANLVEVTMKEGEVLVRQGEYRPVFSLVLAGEVAAMIRSGGQQIPTNRFVAPSFFGGASLLSGAPAPGTLVAVCDGRLGELAAPAFRELLAACEPFSRLIFRHTIDRLNLLESTARNREKLAALGTLAAGLAHELNNPAAALARTADCTLAALGVLKDAAVELSHCAIPPETLNALDALSERRPPGGAAQSAGALQRSEAEDALANWLAEHGVQRPWLMAPCLVKMGIAREDLAPAAASLTAGQFTAGMHWLVATMDLRALMEDTRLGAARISEIVRAMKSYSYMDRAPQQEVDLRVGIEDTLTILHHKLKQGVSVRLDFDRELPHVVAYGSELNQVWTNLIDNAIDAMQGTGEIVVRTRRELDFAVVEITDNGPGIAPDVMPHLFEPFFTTKPQGQGTGLGLDISYQTVVNRHGGAIHVKSRPGETTFQVRLPLMPRTPANAAAP